MRGIAVIGGEGPKPAICRGLAEGADIVLAADSGLAAAEDAGLLPDWIVGDMDSLDDPGRLEKYPPERIRRFPGDKDYTDTELALSCLWEQGCAEIWLAGGGGGRVDHLFAIRSLFEREPCPARWITAREDMRCVKARGELNLTLFPGSLVSVFPLGEGPWDAGSSGLKWPLAGCLWNRGSFGISNVAVDGHCSVHVTKGKFLIIVPLAD
ncbi:MAG: thiamine diphosphokinase [Treponema sp.]|nr:thiamine diphosphokinase [Treponema sp.]